jgi:hypothetical protein
VGVLSLNLPFFGNSFVAQWMYFNLSETHLHGVF